MLGRSWESTRWPRASGMDFWARCLKPMSINEYIVPYPYTTIAMSSHPSKRANNPETHAVWRTHTQHFDMPCPQGGPNGPGRPPFP